MNVNVSIASVAKANTLSISHKMLSLSTYLPPLLYVVSKSVFQNQKAKVEVLLGLPRHSITALRGIKINVLNVKTLFNNLSLTMNKSSSKYSNFICLNKTVISDRLFNEKQQVIVSERIVCDGFNINITRLLLALCGVSSPVSDQMCQC